jgi:hypothetical protein
VLPIRGDEADAVLSLKLGQLDTLVKLAIIYSYGRLGLGVLSRFTLDTKNIIKSIYVKNRILADLAIHHDLVIYPKLTLRHPGQVGLHLDLPRHVCGQHLALR